MQITNINNHLNLQTYNNVKRIVEEEQEQYTAPQTFYDEHENYELPPFYVYDKWTKKHKNTLKTIWTSEKIMEMTEVTLCKFCNLIDKNEVSIQNINKMIYNIFPDDVAENIVFLDYEKDFKTYLKNKNKLNDEQVKEFMRIYKAFKGCDEKGRTLIFIPFGDIYKTDFERVMCKNYFAHEIKHALTSLTTNIEQEDIDKIGNTKLADKYCNIFKELEHSYDFNFETNEEKLNPTELTEDNLVKNILNLQTNQNFNNKDELIDDIENEIIFILNKYNLSHKTLEQPSFCNYLQHYAKDEKEAYTFLKVLRELNHNTSQPVKIELRVLKYSLFEDFFKNKTLNL